MERTLFAVTLFGEGIAVRLPDPVSREDPRAEVRGRISLLVRRESRDTLYRIREESVRRRP